METRFGSLKKISGRCEEYKQKLKRGWKTGWDTVQGEGLQRGDGKRKRKEVTKSIVNVKVDNTYEVIKRMIERAVRTVIRKIC